MVAQRSLQIAAEIHKSISALNRTDIQYFMNTVNVERGGSEAIFEIKKALRQMGYFVSEFLMFDDSTNSEDNFLYLYLCWTEEAKRDAISRGYSFDEYEMRATA